MLLSSVFPLFNSKSLLVLIVLEIIYLIKSLISINPTLSKTLLFDLKFLPIIIKGVVILSSVITKSWPNKGMFFFKFFLDQDNHDQSLKWNKFHHVYI